MFRIVKILRINASLFILLVDKRKIHVLEILFCDFSPSFMNNYAVIFKISYDAELTAIRA